MWQSNQINLMSEDVFIDHNNRLYNMTALLGDSNVSNKTITHKIYSKRTTFIHSTKTYLHVLAKMLLTDKNRTIKNV